MITYIGANSPTLKALRITFQGKAITQHIDAQGVKDVLNNIPKNTQGIFLNHSTPPKYIARIRKKFPRTPIIGLKDSDIFLQSPQGFILHPLSDKFLKHDISFIKSGGDGVRSMEKREALTAFFDACSRRYTNDRTRNIIATPSGTIIYYDLLTLARDVRVL